MAALNLRGFHVGFVLGLCPKNPANDNWHAQGCNLCISKEGEIFRLGFRSVFLTILKEMGAVPRLGGGAGFEQGMFVPKTSAVFFKSKRQQLSQTMLLGCKTERS